MSKRWTKEEDKVLIDKVTRYSYNLKKAFQESSRLLERTPTACAQRWYSTVSKQKDTMCFATVCYRGTNHNRKNTIKGKNKTLSWWKRLLKFLMN